MYLNGRAAWQLDQFKKELSFNKRSSIGFPLAKDFDYSEIAPLFNEFLNNVGDPFEQGLFLLHSKTLEQEVIHFFAQLFRAPKDGYWGYITSGSTEGNMYGLYKARQKYPKGVVYYSQSAHYSVPKNIDLLSIKSHKVATQQSGEVDYEALKAALQKNSKKPAIIVANIGTTMTEAKDDISKIKNILHDLSIKDYFIHIDAALAGSYIGFVNPRHPYDFEDGADSITVSGYKFIGAPMPCGIVLIKKDYLNVPDQKVSYIDNHDTTLSGSRSGHTALCLWYAIQRWGIEGIRQRYLDCIKVVEHAEEKLKQINWPVWRNPNAITLMLKQPPEHLNAKWQLAKQNGWSHIICMPGVTKTEINNFVDDLAASQSL